MMQVNAIVNGNICIHVGWSCWNHTAIIVVPGCEALRKPSLAIPTSTWQPGQCQWHCCSVTSDFGITRWPPKMIVAMKTRVTNQLWNDRYICRNERLMMMIHCYYSLLYYMIHWWQLNFAAVLPVIRAPGFGHDMRNLYLHHWVYRNVSFQTSFQTGMFSAL